MILQSREVSRASYAYDIVLCFRVGQRRVHSSHDGGCSVGAVRGSWPASCPWKSPPCFGRFRQALANHASHCEMAVDCEMTIAMPKCSTLPECDARLCLAMRDCVSATDCNHSERLQSHSGMASRLQTRRAPSLWKSPAMTRLHSHSGRRKIEPIKTATALH